MKKRVKVLAQSVNRSSKTGRFVSAQFAKRHKATTQKQRVMVPHILKRRSTR